jgi:hypothetical protein
MNVRSIAIALALLCVCSSGLAEKEKIYCVDRVFEFDDCYLSIDHAKAAFTEKAFWNGRPRNIYERDMAIKETD